LQKQETVQKNKIFETTYCFFKN